MNNSYKLKKYIKIYILLYKSTIKIQSFWKKYYLRNKTKPEIYNYNKIYNCIIYIQSYWKGYNFRNKKVLEPCDINEVFIDILKLKKILINDYFTKGRIEFIKSTSTKNLKLEDDYMEFITAKSIDGKRISDGNCPIDIIKDNIGIDVLCVCLNGTRTNEKSIMQKFSNCGNNLDNLFKNFKYKEALNKYRNEYYKKILNAKKLNNIDKLYYFAYISTNKNVYISTFKINIECIINFKFEDITKQKKSIKFKGFINENIGNTTLFKSKKRLEVRFNKEILNGFNTLKII